MYENKKTTVQGVHYSRYIMSWLRAGGTVWDANCKEFENLLAINGVTKEETADIQAMMLSGKFELEQNADHYVFKLKIEREKKRILKELQEENGKKQKIEVKHTKVDIHRLKPDVQNWMRRCYNKRNGIKE